MCGRVPPRAAVMSASTRRVCVDVDDVTVARLDRLAAYIAGSGLAQLTRDELIVDAIERYLHSAEMAAPGIAGVPLDLEPPAP